MEENIFDFLETHLQIANKTANIDVANAITAIINDLKKINEENVSRQQVLDYVNSRKEEMQKSNNTDVASEHFLDFLEYQFRPMQLTEDQTRNILSEIVKLNPDITEELLLKTFTEEFPNRYDEKLTTEIVRELLNNSGS